MRQGTTSKFSKYTVKCIYLELRAYITIYKGIEAVERHFSCIVVLHYNLSNNLAMIIERV